MVRRAFYLRIRTYGADLPIQRYSDAAITVGGPYRLVFHRKHHRLAWRTPHRKVHTVLYIEAYIIHANGTDRREEASHIAETNMAIHVGEADRTTILSWSLVCKLVDQGNCSYNNDQMACRVSSVSLMEIVV